MQYDWGQLIERLAYHRTRLGIDKPTMSAWIRRTYGVGFWQLSDDQLIEMGKTMAQSETAEQLLGGVGKTDAKISS